jgi:hypothetical protein
MVTESDATPTNKSKTQEMTRKNATTKTKQARKKIPPNAKHLCIISGKPQMSTQMQKQ